MKTRTWLIVLGICAIAFGGLGWQAQHQEILLSDNWQLYRNTEWGFELSYPSYFSFEDSNDKKSDHFVTTTLVQIANPKDMNAHTEGIPVFQVSVIKQPFKFQGEIYTDPYKAAQSLFEGYGDQAQMKKTKIGELDAIEITFHNETIGIGVPDREYVVLKDGFIYTITWDLNYPEFSQTASSFNFIK